MEEFHHIYPFLECPETGTEKMALITDKNSDEFQGSRNLRISDLSLSNDH